LAVVNVICTCECCSCECFIMFVEVINVCLPYYSCECFPICFSCECYFIILQLRMFSNMLQSWMFFFNALVVKKCLYVAAVNSHTAVVNVLAFFCSCKSLINMLQLSVLSTLFTYCRYECFCNMLQLWNFFIYFAVVVNAFQCSSNILQLLMWFAVCSCKWCSCDCFT
jgi:hypothetical protein